MTHIQMDEALSARDAATYTGRHINTIRRWIKSGLVPYTRMGTRGHYRIRQSDLDAAMASDPQDQSELQPISV